MSEYPGFPEPVQTLYKNNGSRMERTLKWKEGELDCKPRGCNVELSDVLSFEKLNLNS